MIITLHDINIQLPFRRRQEHSLVDFDLTQKKRRGISITKLASHTNPYNSINFHQRLSPTSEKSNAR